MIQLKKTLLTLLIIMTAPLVAGASLYQFYALQGQKLPSVKDRAEVATQCGINKYIGSLEQNNRLEVCLRKGDSTFMEALPDIPNPTGLLGAVVPVRPTDFKTYLDQTFTEGHANTSVRVTSISTRDGNTLNGAILGTLIVLSINPGSSNSETVSCTGLTSSTKTFTGCTFGYRFDSPTSTQATNIKSHSPGEPVIISNTDTYNAQNFVSALGDMTITGSWIFNNYPSTSGTVNCSSNNQFCTKAYIDGVGAGGFTSVNVGVGLLAMGTSPEKVRIDLAATSTSALGFFGNSLSIVTSTMASSLRVLSDGIAVSTSTSYIWSVGHIWQGTSSTFSGNLQVNNLYVSSTLLTATHTSSTIPILNVGYIGSTSTSATTTVFGNVDITGDLTYNQLRTKPIVYTRTTTEDANGITSDIEWDYTDFPYTPSLLQITCAVVEVGGMTYGTASAPGSEQSENIKTATFSQRQSTTQIMDNNYAATTDLQWNVFQMSATSTQIKRVEVPSATSNVHCLWSIQ